jgi:hypothetical protein
VVLVIGCHFLIIKGLFRSFVIFLFFPYARSCILLWVITLGDLRRFNTLLYSKFTLRLPFVMLCASAVLIFAVYLSLASPSSVNMPTAVIPVLIRSFTSALVQTFVAAPASVLALTSVLAFGHTSVLLLALMRGLSLPTWNLTMSLDPLASTSPMVPCTPPETWSHRPSLCQPPGSQSFPLLVQLASERRVRPHPH